MLAVVDVLVDGVSEIGELMNGSLGWEWFGIALWQYLVALLFLLLSLFARRGAEALIRRFIVPLLQRSESEYPGKIAEAVTRPLAAFINIFGLFFAARTLLINVEARTAEPLITPEFVNQTFEVAIAVIVIWLALRLVDVLTLYISERAKASELPMERNLIPLVRKTLKFLVLTIGGLSVVHQLGYQISSILGGLGIGGLAVALAAQDALSNVFGSVIVFTDKPFKVGDWIKIGDVEGTVEQVGFRSSRIRTFARTLITLPNKTIANSHVENFSAMPIRRVRFELRVSYEATADQMETLVKRIEQLIEEHPGVDKSFYMIKFTDLAEGSLNILVYYFSITTVWKEHLQVRQEVNLGIMRIMDELGLSIAVPARTLYIAREDQRLLGSRKRPPAESAFDAIESPVEEDDNQ